MFSNVVKVVSGENGSKKMKQEYEGKMKGTAVVLMKNSLLDAPSVISDTFDELIGHKVSLQLISAVHVDPENGIRGKLGGPVHLQNWIAENAHLSSDEMSLVVEFDYTEEVGVPGALLVRNNHHKEFYLKTFTLEHVPGHGRIHFVCNSWIYHTEPEDEGRVFFTNKTYLPHETPVPLRKYREEELVKLRGTGKGQLGKGDRVYEYAYYNDLGEPDKGEDHARPILGGSDEYPYPRRTRTGREPTKTDPKTESRIPLYDPLSIYVPSDEKFSYVKLKESLIDGLKSISQLVGPEIKALLGDEFDSFDEVLSLYRGGIKVPDGPLENNNNQNSFVDMFKKIFRGDGANPFKFPVPQVIEEDTTAWTTDEEFGREMLAGLNPVMIRRLEEFPPASRLNRELYGCRDSTITKGHVEINLEGLNVDEALELGRLFILDHHDNIMPYLRRMNDPEPTLYASRTVLFLKGDGTLKPVAIELSLPHPNGDHYGPISSVYTPCENGVEGSIWKLAKAYVAINDSGYHQLISHWLHTHATMEPFVIASNRQLSVIHPIHKLLHPHFRDTLNINALARQILINAGGALEYTVFPGKYSMEFSSSMYKNWDFTKQALPEDLKSRGIAIEDQSSQYGLRLLIEDYPYAVDGLEIWYAIRNWVQVYCSSYYDTDYAVQNDPELQSWWKEVREEGHGDLKHEKWWPKMETCEELIESCTTIIWIASALHAAINFGQYPYGGYLPNRPTISRRLMPQKGSEDYKELESNNFEKVFFKTITSKPVGLLGVSLIEILSRHSSDEVYLGERDTPQWTCDAEALEAFENFKKELEAVEDRIMQRNSNPKLRNRVGPVNMPYTLLVPTSGVGLTGMGIPNSVSI